MASSSCEEAEVETVTDAESPEPFDDENGRAETPELNQPCGVAVVSGHVGLPLSLSYNEDSFFDAGEENYNEAGEDEYEDTTFCEESVEVPESQERPAFIEGTRELAESPESQNERSSSVASQRCADLNHLDESYDDLFAVPVSCADHVLLGTPDMEEDEAADVVFSILDVAGVDDFGDEDYIVEMGVEKPFSQPFLPYYVQNFRSLGIDNLASDLFSQKPTPQVLDTSDETLREKARMCLVNAVNAGTLKKGLEEAFSLATQPDGAGALVSLSQVVAGGLSLFPFKTYYQEHFRASDSRECYARRLFPNPFVADGRTTVDDEIVELRREADSASTPSPEALHFDIAQELVALSVSGFGQSNSTQLASKKDLVIASDSRITAKQCLLAAAVDGSLDNVLAEIAAETREEAGLRYVHNFAVTLDEPLQAKVRDCLLSAMCDGSLEASIDDIVGQSPQTACTVEHLPLRLKLANSLCTAAADGRLERSIDALIGSRIHESSEAPIKAKLRSALFMAMENDTLEGTIRGATLRETVRNHLTSSAENCTLGHESLKSRRIADGTIQTTVRNKLLASMEDGSLQRVVETVSQQVSCQMNTRSDADLLTKPLEQLHAKARSDLLLAWKSGKLETAVAAVTGKNWFRIYYAQHFQGVRLCETLSRKLFCQRHGNLNSRVESDSLVGAGQRTQSVAPFNMYYQNNFKGCQIVERTPLRLFSVASRASPVQEGSQIDDAARQEAASAIQKRERQRAAKAKVGRLRKERIDSMISKVTKWALDTIAVAAIEKVISMGSGETNASIKTIVNRLSLKCNHIAEGRIATSQAEVEGEVERNAATSFTRRSLHNACLRAEARLHSVITNSALRVPPDVIDIDDADIAKRKSSSKPEAQEDNVELMQQDQIHRTIEHPTLETAWISKQPVAVVGDMSELTMSAQPKETSTFQQSRLQTPTTMASRQLSSALAEELCSAICVGGDFEAVVSTPILFALENNLALDDLPSIAQIVSSPSKTIRENKVESGASIEGTQDAPIEPALFSEDDDDVEFPKHEIVEVIKKHPQANPNAGMEQLAEFDWASSHSPESEVYSWQMPERANLLYSKSLWEERIARAVMRGEPSSSISDSTRSKASQRRFYRASPGYDVIMHHSKEEARIASRVFKADVSLSCDDSTDVPSVLASHLSSHQSAADPMILDDTSLEFSALGIDSQDVGSTTELAPQRPIGSSAGSSRPTRRYLQSEGSLGEVEAWLPLRGSSSSVQLTPRPPSKPKASDDRKGFKSCRPLRRPAAKSRWVIDFPIESKSDAESMVSCHAWKPKDHDDDSVFLATLDSLRSGSAGTSSSVDPVRRSFQRKPPVWSSEWANTPSRYRFAKGSTHLISQSEPSDENQLDAPLKSALPVSHVLPPVKIGSLRFFTVPHERPVTTSVLNSSEYRQRLHAFSLFRGVQKRSES